MTSKEIQLIIKQAVQEAREETKKEIYHQIKIITDIDPASDEGLHKLRDVFNWAKSGTAVDVQVNYVDENNLTLTANTAVTVNGVVSV